MNWVQLRREAVCAWGCEIARRAWVLQGRLGRRYYGRRFLVCEAHALSHYGLQPPVIEPSTIRDGKALAVGDDE